MLGRCRSEARWATPSEQRVLARWSGWGAVPQVFDESDTRFASERDEVRRLLRTDDAWAQARRTTLNAHYTSAEVVQAVWRAAEALGFTDGRVLEPGCGSGNFLGFAPDGVELVGVELDGTTAAMAKQLYGARAVIRSHSFEDLREPDGSFDLAIGNVPFGKVAPFDPRHNRREHTVHNYFLIKALHLVRPGGLVMALTSRFTLDARNPAARQEMADLADLVGAIRLPERAFAASSGTDVVTDLLVLRRRPADATPVDKRWTGTVAVDLFDADGNPPSESLWLNEYLAEHPEFVLGELTMDRGMYREHELTVKPTGPVVPHLGAAVDRMVIEAQATGLLFAPGSGTPASGKPTAAYVPSVEEQYKLRFAQDGSFVVSRSGEIGQYADGTVRSYRPPVDGDINELRRLIGLRDAAREVLAVQLADGTDTEVEAVQHVLADQYERYRRYYGPLNRYRMVRTGHRDPETGEVLMRRDYPRMGGFRRDPDWPLVAALEVFDDETQQARPAPIFTQRVVAPPHDRHRARSPADAVAVCLDESGAVTRERVAELLGVTESEARQQIGDLAFDDPDTGDLVPAPHYLAGNVREKLEAAEAVAARDGDPRWQANIRALQQALPAQLQPGEITVRLGAPWVEAADVETFCAEVLDASVAIEHLRSLGKWTVKLHSSRRMVALTSQWGTRRADGVTLLDAALNQRLHTVFDTVDKRRVRNDAETIAAREKQEELNQRFGRWIWEDATRGQRVIGAYNRMFRSVVLPRYDGSHLSLPGLAANFEPRGHQRDAVARILTDGRALLAHAVGAGKTATMVMAAMELKRLGSATKPAVVVPNHMLEQFSREWLQLYPTAKVLIADSGQLDKDRRKAFVARCATGDWDGIVFTHSGFEAIPLGRVLTREYLGLELDAAREALAESKSGKRLTVKRLEASIARMEQTYRKLLSEQSKDDGVRFEETGIDYVFVDEAHLFKNRRVLTSIDGVAHQGSQRAQDLDAKLWALRKTQGVRCATFATATPVANSVAELWVMQSYLQPDLLEGLHMRAFDAWAAAFGRLHTALELAPDGASYRMQTRFARFQNLPELLGVYHQVADVRTREDLNLPVPEVVGGKAEAVVVPPSDGLREYVAHLADRAEQIRGMRVRPDEDNMLKVTLNGRQAALDLRLVYREPDPTGGKVAAAARRIAAIHHATRDVVYRDSVGEPSSRTGALQLVFCDVSTPASTHGWNAYDELRDQLVRRGVPRESVRFMQDAGTHAAKAKLFADCRDGKVAVLIGSTETMGVGTNVQARAVALHHLDAPWRPADIEQREGRIVRQGNQNPTVEIIRYVTEASFDIYMWQTLERKAAFIAQVSRGDVGEREIDDFGEQVLSFAEVKALATGDPRIMEKAGVDSDVARLGRLERAWQDDQAQLRVVLEKSQTRIESLTARVDRVRSVLDRVVDTSGDKFAMTVAGESYTKRMEAGEHLKTLLADRLANTPDDTTTDFEPIGQLAGLDIVGQTTTAIEDEILLQVAETDIQLRFLAPEWDDRDPAKIVQSLEHRIRGLPDALAQLQEDIDTVTHEATQAESRLGMPFEHAAQLTHLRHRQQELDEQLMGGTAAPTVSTKADLNSAFAGTNGIDRAAPSSSRAREAGHQGISL